MSDNPFEKLIRSKVELDHEYQQRLADILEPYIWIDPEQGEVVFKNSAPNITAREKIFVFLLGLKVIAHINTDIEGISSPSEIVELTGLPGGTVRPRLKSLFEEKLLSRDERGYKVADHVGIAEIDSAIKAK